MTSAGYQLRIPIEVPRDASTGGGPTPPPPVSGRSFFDLFFGVVIPLIAILVELTTRMSAEAFFNPLPTRWHAALAFAVPLANLVIWLRPGVYQWPLALANALALVVASVYSLFYLPLLPISLLAVLFLLGFLPLSPYFALIVAIRQRRQLATDPLTPKLYGPLAIAAILVLTVNLPAIVTHAGLEWSRTNPRAIWLLRNFGDADVILEACHGRGGSLMSLWKPSITPSEARIVYYQVTGETADSRSPGLDKDMSLAQSSLDGSVDLAAQLGYLEWTMSFANTSTRQQEARALLELPPGAVVSRVTLWVNGEPREAAFGTRSQVREAYQRVVSARRDPLLVTTAGPGRVLVQCFPVPPNGEMKIRLGITQPLAGGELLLPRFAERNFALNTTHALWIDAGTATVRESLTDDGLLRAVKLPWAEPAPVSWTPDSAGFRIKQRFESRTLNPPSKLFIVVDGSRSMRPFAAEIQRAITQAAKTIPVESSFTGEFEGGVDNIPALLEAQDHALGQPGSAILWITGPQPLLLSSPEPLRQAWSRRPGVAPLFAIQLVPGPNRVLSQLDGVKDVQLLQMSLDAALARFTTPHTIRAPILTRLKGAQGQGHRTSDHLARLWAHQEVLTNGSARLASDYHLVTPVSGAVVLETRQQYEAAGLKPVESGTVPSVPEPETWALMAIGVAVILVAKCRRRNSCTS